MTTRWRGGRGGWAREGETVNHPVGIFKADQKPATTWDEFMEQWEANEGTVAPLEAALSMLYTEGETFAGYVVRKASVEEKSKRDRAVLLSLESDIVDQMRLKGYTLCHSAVIVDVDFYARDGRSRFDSGQQRESMIRPEHHDIPRLDRSDGPGFMYTTPRGVRLVWKSGPSSQEDAVQWALRRGLFVDPTSLDWTREYRLPRDHYGFQRIVRGA